MQISFDLGNEFSKTFSSSHKKLRTQEVNSKGNKEGSRRIRKKKKEKF